MTLAKVETCLRISLVCDGAVRVKQDGHTDSAVTYMNWCLYQLQMKKRVKGQCLLSIQPREGGNKTVFMLDFVVFDQSIIVTLKSLAFYILKILYLYVVI